MMVLPDSEILATKRNPKIALIADVENWAFHNISKQIVRYLSDSYDFQIFFYGQYEHIEDLMLEVKDFDLIHFFWRDALFSFLSDYVKQSFDQRQEDYFDFITNIVANANITTSASEHLLISKTEAPERVILYNALAIGYTTFSQKLNDALSRIPNYPPPNNNTEDGVDLEFFKPVNPERFYGEKEEIIIGWVGNSKWGQDVDGIDHKGLETIIKPAIESLRQAGYNVRGYFADRQERWIPHGEMNDYYNSIDIYVCASDIEGTPNPALESMACGIPVISTDVGIIPQLFGTRQKNYILSSRRIDELKTKLKELIEQPEKRRALSEENLESIRKWSWEKKCQDWDGFFRQMLASSGDKIMRKRRDYLRRQTLAMYLMTGAEDELERQTAELREQVSGLEEALKEREISAEEYAGQMRMKIGLMEESKFWKIRNAWFKMKDKVKR